MLHDAQLNFIIAIILSLLLCSECYLFYIHTTFSKVGNQVETGIKRALFLLLLASIITFPDIQYIFTNTFSRLYTDFFKDRVGKLRIYLSVQHNHIPSLCHDLRWLHSVKLHINVFISDATNKKEKNSVMTMIYCNYNAQFK